MPPKLMGKSSNINCGQDFLLDNRIMIARESMKPMVPPSPLAWMPAEVSTGDMLFGYPFMLTKLWAITTPRIAPTIDPAMTMTGLTSDFV
jgi:hypothetical protein